MLSLCILFINSIPLQITKIPSTTHFSLSLPHPFSPSPFLSLLSSPYPLSPPKNSQLLFFISFNPPRHQHRKSWLQNLQPNKNPIFKLQNHNQASAHRHLMALIPTLILSLHMLLISKGSTISVPVTCQFKYMNTFL